MKKHLFHDNSTLFFIVQNVRQRYSCCASRQEMEKKAIKITMSEFSFILIWLYKYNLGIAVCVLIIEHKKLHAYDKNN